MIHGDKTPGRLGCTRSNTKYLLKVITSFIFSEPLAFYDMILRSGNTYRIFLSNLKSFINKLMYSLSSSQDHCCQGIFFFFFFAPLAISLGNFFPLYCIALSVTCWGKSPYRNLTSEQHKQREPDLPSHLKKQKCKDVFTTNVPKTWTSGW